MNYYKLYKTLSDKMENLLFVETGQSHYIPVCWIGITWKAKEGKPNFVK